MNARRRWLAPLLGVALLVPGAAHADPRRVCPAGDTPDPGFVDSNCDGIDGDVSAALFVPPGGSDSAAGTQAAPLQTLGAAVDRAQAAGSPVTQILLAAGTYAGG